jgi:hypothetical protein
MGHPKGVKKIGFARFAQNTGMGIAGHPDGPVHTFDPQVELLVAHPTAVMSHQEFHDFVNQSLFGTRVVGQRRFSTAESAAKAIQAFGIFILNEKKNGSKPVFHHARISHGRSRFP